MAVAAETLSDTSPVYRLVDTIPEVAAGRNLVRTEAELLLEERRASPGYEASGLPLPVDALSTADRVIQAGQEHGHDSSERAKRWDGLALDCQRMVGEWYRRMTSERFEPLRHTFDPKTEEFFSHGLSTSQMTKNGLVPMPDSPEDEARRVNERVEDATPLIVRRALGGAALNGAQVVRTISECTDKAIADYAEDVQTGERRPGYGGYVPEIEKVMIRDIWIDTETGDRFEEQIALPGTYITHGIIQEALHRRQVEGVEYMDKTQLHGAQILADDNLMAFTKLLDQVASEEWCDEIFMGDKLPEGATKDYDGFWEESQRRKESLVDTAETVASYVLDLAQDGVDRRQALVMVEKFVKMLLLDIGKEKGMVVAEQIFDKKTAEGLQEVAYLESIGRYDAAFDCMQAVEKAAPGDGYCGAGSCGITGVNTHSDEGKEISEKLQANSGDKVVKDDVRRCKCGSKSVFYAYNKTKVNKFCTSCGAFESKVSGVKVA